MADGYIQEYSTHGSTTLNDYAYYAIENNYEPTQLTVTRAARYTDQDVIIGELSSGGFDTICLTDSAAIYGSHHHKVCDRKKIRLNTAGSAWANLSVNDRKWIIAHEFGHQVGQAHSGGPCTTSGTAADYECGRSETGTYQANTHPNGLGSLMWPYYDDGAAYTLHSHDVSHINAHY